MNGGNRNANIEKLIRYINGLAAPGEIMKKGTLSYSGEIEYPTGKLGEQPSR